MATRDASNEMEETMHILSKGIKWLAILMTGGYLVGAASAPHAFRNFEREPIAPQACEEIICYPVLGFNEALHLLAR